MTLSLDGRLETLGDAYGNGFANERFGCCHARVDGGLVDGADRSDGAVGRSGGGSGTAAEKAQEKDETEDGGNDALDLGGDTAKAEDPEHDQDDEDENEQVD